MVDGLGFGGLKESGLGAAGLLARLGEGGEFAGDTVAVEGGFLEQVERVGGKAEFVLGDWQSALAHATGVQTAYQYDSLKRKIAAVKVGIGSQPNVTNVTVYDASSRVIELDSVAGSLGLTQKWAYDWAGRMTTNVDESGLTTSVLYQDGGRSIVTNLPSGASVTRSITLTVGLRALRAVCLISRMQLRNTSPPGTRLPVRLSGGRRWTTSSKSSTGHDKSSKRSSRDALCRASENQKSEYV